MVTIVRSIPAAAHAFPEVTKAVDEPQSKNGEDTKGVFTHQ